MTATSWVTALWISLFPPENHVDLSAKCHQNCKASESAVKLIGHFEGYSPFVYKDAAGYPTIGHGHMITPHSKYSEPLLPDAAHALLKQDVGKTERGVNRKVHVPLKQHQADALISFTFNVGEGALGKSTLLKRVNQERHADVPDQFLRWVYAGGRKLLGLEHRRAAEAALYGYDIK